MATDTPDKDAIGPDAANGHPQERENKTDKDAPPITPKSHAIPPVGNAYTTKQKKKCWLEWGKFAVEVLTLIVIFVYTGIAYHQWEEMRKATKATQDAATAAKSAADTAHDSHKQSIEAFRIDERAWVEIGKIEKTATYPPDPPFGTIFKFGIYPKNVGKTVARDVKIHVDNIDADSSFNENKKAIGMFQEQRFHEMGTGKRIVTPDKPGPQTIAPGDLSPVPVYSGGQEPRKYGNNVTYTFLLGRIDYTDAFDVKHWMRFCFIISNSRGELGHCQYGNDEDSNPENPN